ncbi:TetR/AcrR family transcriptional regulator [Luteipulveratus flavus]|uniref:TetR family transcriptional regulator n=1 Tax=Luteipulveratus flavus TaxID=3031728 RepID=A0ABT6CA83_9MICO|nr:TetR family transcriptional regulator [Luteipulveratus sp. YIM 133296]MDF8265705.1 TetR family transcriptional regulator [Luteipulveratus sp. YIM 133296]
MARIPAEERRRLLVEAAIRVMTRDGVAKATTRSIVAEADMQLGMFHYCFRSKEELLEQVVQTITAHSLERVGDLAKERGTINETLRATMRSYWEHVVANPAEHQLTYDLTQYCQRRPGFEWVAQRQYEFYLETMGRLLDDAAERLGVQYRVPTTVVARYLITIIDGLTLNWLILRDDGGDPEAVLDQAAEHVAGLASAVDR